MAFDLESARPINKSEKAEKKTGSFDLSSAKPISGRNSPGYAGVLERTAEAEQAISKRPTIQKELSQIAEKVIRGNALEKTMAGLQALDIPRNLLESAISNPALSIQQGNINPIELAKQAALGISGQRRGQIGDVGRIAGYGDVASGAMGLMVGGVTPVTAARKAQKFFGAVSKWSDKKILEAGSSLVKATEDAVSTMGRETAKAFEVVGGSTASRKEALNIYTKIKKNNSLYTAVEEELGVPLTEVFKNPTVSNLRKVKQIIGEYRPGLFGKEQRGLAENIEAKNINALYADLKTTLFNTIKRSHGDEAARSVMNAEKAFAKTKNASDYIKKTITDPTLKEATKAGSMAKKIILEGDVSGRTALNRVKEASKVSRREINRAVNALQAFNSSQAISQALQHTAQAAFYGGAIGGIGGMAAGKILKNTGD